MKLLEKVNQSGPKILIIGLPDRGFDAIGFSSILSAGSPVQDFMGDKNIVI
jgi:hypothetical protein